LYNLGMSTTNTKTANASHSPAPWKSELCALTDANGQKLATIHGKRTMASETVTANARLIAAAPELLAALRWTLRHVEGLYDECAASGDTDEENPWWPTVKAARAAIAKATGST
jgi:hypothetical protein